MFPCAFFWHNGHADDKCQFIGLHIHLLLGSKDHLSQIYRYRNIVSKMQSRGLDVKSQKVRFLQALGKHLLKTPRILMGCNNIQFCSQIYRWKKEVDETKDPITENDFENFNFDKDEMPLENNKNEEGLTGVNFLTSFLKVNQKNAMLKKTGRNYSTKREKLTVLFFFPRGVLDEISNLVESVSEGFPSYFYIKNLVQWMTSKSSILSHQIVRSRWLVGWLILGLTAL